jgi:hypothetical protein
MNRMYFGAAMKCLLTGVMLVCAVPAAFAANNELLDGELQPLLGEPAFEMQQLFAGERFPNVVVATDGTVLATWGSKQVRVRRSEDGGKTWRPEIVIGDGIHGGGVIVDETSGDVLVFTHPEHPPRKPEPAAPRRVYRSTDHGQTWQPIPADFKTDRHGYVPALHMSEKGLTLQRGPYPSRLLRPARVYIGEGQRGHLHSGYNTAIYSDDGGMTWRASEPFPDIGTGEGAIVELADGELLYSSRKQYFHEDQPLHAMRYHARSRDGGATWQSLEQVRALPDGPRYRGADPRGSNYNGHFGLMAGLERLPHAQHDVLLYTSTDNNGHQRQNLTVWASFDGGKSWPVKRLVHQGPGAYSSLAAGRPGTPSEGWIYLQFEHGKDGQQYAGGQMARFNLAWLLAGEATGDGRLPDG